MPLLMEELSISSNVENRGTIYEGNDWGEEDVRMLGWG